MADLMNNLAAILAMTRYRRFAIAVGAGYLLRHST
jgi:hypothetical protein